MKEKSFSDKIHFVGRASSIITILTFMAVAFSICAYFDIFPTVSEIVAATLFIYTIAGPNSVVEFLSYTATLGSGASYISFITGNIPNMKIPSIMSSLSACEVDTTGEDGAERKEVLSVIIAAVASLEVLTLILLMVVASGALQPFLQWEPIQPAFTYILPTIYGMVIVGPLMKAPKVVIPVMVFSIIVTKLTNNMAIMLVACIVLALILCRIFGKKKTA